MAAAEAVRQDVEERAEKISMHSVEVSPQLFLGQAILVADRLGREEDRAVSEVGANSDVFDAVEDLGSLQVEEGFVLIGA